MLMAARRLVVLVGEGLADQVAALALVERLFGGVVVELLDDAGLDAREAFETPGDVGDLVDEIFLRGAAGFEIEFHFSAVSVVVVGVFAGDEGIFGAEAVFECVAGATLFAFRGAGTG
jgi:hypothetical protein